MGERLGGAGGGAEGATAATIDADDLGAVAEGESPGEHPALGQFPLVVIPLELAQREKLGGALDSSRTSAYSSGSGAQMSGSVLFIRPPWGS